MVPSISARPVDGDPLEPPTMRAERPSTPRDGRRSERVVRVQGGRALPPRLLPGVFAVI